MNVLVHLSYSPWSEKARWALDHHRVETRKIEYLPIVGEPLLRLRLGKLRGKVSVPVLFSRSGALTDSLAIARWADRQGRAHKLFPTAHEAEIGRWNERSERLLAAGRAAALDRGLESPAALREGLPGPLRRGGKAALALAAQTARALRAKYREGDAVAAQREPLEQLRAALGGRRYLFGELSYADIAMAVGLQLLSPVADRFVRLGPATREVCTDPELAREFADLVAWRDALYAEHR